MLAVERKNMSIGRISFKGNGTSKLLEYMSKVKTSEAKHFLLKSDLQRELNEVMPTSIKWFDKLNKKLSGEIPNILITALGTGLFAPFFIRYNFMSHTDKDTRTYSAWRQPISAALAVLTQATVVNRFDKYMAKKSNEGKFENPDFNQNFLQDESYIENVIKKENPKLKGIALKDEIARRQAKQLDNFVENIYSEGTMAQSIGGKRVLMDQKKFKDLLMDTINGSKTSINEDVKRYEGSKPSLQIKRGDYLRLHENDVKKELGEIKTQVGELNDYKKVTKWLESKIKTLKTTKKHPELISIIEDIKSNPNINAMQDKINDLHNKCGNFSKCSTYEEVEKIVKDKIKIDIDKKQLEKTVLEKFENIICTNKNPIKKLKKLAKSKEFRPYVTDVVYGAVQKQLGDVKGNIKGIKSRTGLYVSLAILPVTCMLLNWIYPKFMDVFFPNLSKKKQNKSDDKFIKSTYLPTPQHSAEKSQEVDK